MSSGFTNANAFRARLARRYPLSNSLLAPWSTFNGNNRVASAFEVCTNACSSFGAFWESHCRGRLCLASSRGMLLCHGISYRQTDNKVRVSRASLKSGNKPFYRYVDYAMQRVRLLQHYNITPYLVFDGGPLPAKKSTELRRKRWAEACFSMNLNEGYSACLLGSARSLWRWPTRWQNKEDIVWLESITLRLSMWHLKWPFSL